MGFMNHMKDAEGQNDCLQFHVKMGSWKESESKKA